MTEDLRPFLLTFADCAGHATNRAAAAAFVRRVTGAEAAFEPLPGARGVWAAPLPAGWVFVVSNHGSGRQLGWWSSAFFQISVEDDFAPADAATGAAYARDHAEPLPDDWRAPNNLWATVHRYALIPQARVGLVAELLDAENMQNGYPALALPGESVLEYEQRTGALLYD